MKMDVDCKRHKIDLIYDYVHNDVQNQAIRTSLQQKNNEKPTGHKYKTNQQILQPNTKTGQTKKIQQIQEDGQPGQISQRVLQQQQFHSAMGNYGTNTIQNAQRSQSIGQLGLAKGAGLPGSSAEGLTARVVRFQTEDEPQQKVDHKTHAAAASTLPPSKPKNTTHSLKNEQQQFVRARLQRSTSKNKDLKLHLKQFLSQNVYDSESIQMNKLNQQKHDHLAAMLIDNSQQEREMQLQLNRRFPLLNIEDQSLFKSLNAFVERADSNQNSRNANLPKKDAKSASMIQKQMYQTAGNLKNYAALVIHEHSDAPNQGHNRSLEKPVSRLFQQRSKMGTADVNNNRAPRRRMHGTTFTNNNIDSSQNDTFHLKTTQTQSSLPNLQSQRKVNKLSLKYQVPNDLESEQLFNAKRTESTQQKKPKMKIGRDDRYKQSRNKGNQIVSLASLNSSTHPFLELDQHTSNPPDLSSLDIQQRDHDISPTLNHDKSQKQIKLDQQTNIVSGFKETQKQNQMAQSLSQFQISHSFSAEQLGTNDSAMLGGAMHSSVGALHQNAHQPNDDVEQLSQTLFEASQQYYQNHTRSFGMLPAKKYIHKAGGNNAGRKKTLQRGNVIDPDNLELSDSVGNPSSTIKPFSKINNGSSLKSSDKHLHKIMKVQKSTNLNVTSFLNNAITQAAQNQEVSLSAEDLIINQKSIIDKQQVRNKIILQSQDPKYSSQTQFNKNKIKKPENPSSRSQKGAGAAESVYNQQAVHDNKQLIQNSSSGDINSSEYMHQDQGSLDQYFTINIIKHQNPEPQAAHPMHPPANQIPAPALPTSHAHGDKLLTTTVQQTVVDDCHHSRPTLTRLQSNNASSSLTQIKTIPIPLKNQILSNAEKVGGGVSQWRDVFSGNAGGGIGMVGGFGKPYEADAGRETSYFSKSNMRRASKATLTKSEEYNYSQNSHKEYMSNIMNLTHNEFDQDQDNSNTMSKPQLKNSSIISNPQQIQTQTLLNNVAQNSTSSLDTNRKQSQDKSHETSNLQNQQPLGTIISSDPQDQQYLIEVNTTGFDQNSLMREQLADPTSTANLSKLNDTTSKNLLHRSDPAAALSSEQRVKSRTLMGGQPQQSAGSSKNISRLGNNLIEQSVVSRTKFPIKSNYQSMSQSAMTNIIYRKYPKFGNLNPSQKSASNLNFTKGTQSTRANKQSGQAGAEHQKEKPVGKQTGAGGQEANTGPGGIMRQLDLVFDQDSYQFLQPDESNTDDNADLDLTQSESARAVELAAGSSRQANRVVEQTTFQQCLEQSLQKNGLNGLTPLQKKLLKNSIVSKITLPSVDYGSDLNNKTYLFDQTLTIKKEFLDIDRKILIDKDMGLPKSSQPNPIADSSKSISKFKVKKQNNFKQANSDALPTGFIAYHLQKDYTNNYKIPQEIPLKHRKASKDAVKSFYESFLQKSPESFRHSQMVINDDRKRKMIGSMQEFQKNNVEQFFQGSESKTKSQGEGSSTVQEQPSKQLKQPFATIQETVNEGHDDSRVYTPSNRNHLEPSQYLQLSFQEDLKKRQVQFQSMGTDSVVQSDQLQTLQNINPSNDRSPPRTLEEKMLLSEYLRSSFDSDQEQTIGNFLSDPREIDHKKMAPLQFQGNWAAYTESIRRKVQRSKYQLLRRNYDKALRKKQSVPPGRARDDEMTREPNAARNKSCDRTAFEMKKERSSVSLNANAQPQEQVEQLTTYLNEGTPSYVDIQKNQRQNVMAIPDIMGQHAKQSKYQQVEDKQNFEKYIKIIQQHLKNKPNVD